MHWKSDNIEIIINDKVDVVIKEPFDSLIKKYQIELKKSMRGSDFIFDWVHLLYFKCYKIKSNRVGSYIGSLYGILTESNNKCYQ